VNELEEDSDVRLARLTQATQALEPSRDFSARVMGTLERERGVTWLDTVLKPSRRILPTLALAAVVAIAWAVQSEGAVDDALATSYSAAEVAW
jgi:hypothetical protein